MQIAVACDHAGFPLKDEVIAALEEAGCSTIDLGTYNQEPVDYPDYAEKAGRAIINGQAERAVLICGSGVGACIAANKIKGVYACSISDVYSARQGVEHDNMNVLCLGARVIGPETARELVKAFASATFSTEERHRRRVGKILKLEENGKKE
ncbi:MAG: ribose 5-phosphate isomerase B [Anaerolineae bacterium]|nr:ribose 5-phosphate isomerase B [Anaerolineae bacterium]MDO9120739.1 ribose 5-phosphate isomerase B [Anaerolineaceae bacterium]